MKILLTGANGQIGREIIDLARILPLQLYFYTREQLDITQCDQIQQKVLQLKPNYIINAAAYTAVDKAETEKKAAFSINAIGACYLADIGRRFDIPLLHISSDYVFDGEKKTAYMEEDKPNPLSIYGQSKWIGEMFIRKIWHKHIILRVSWVFGTYGNNFVKTVIRAAQEKFALHVVSDQRGAPTYAGDIAKTLLKIVAYLDEGQTDWGTYHYTGTPVTNWYEFAKKIVDKASIQHKLVLKNIFPISAVEYPTIANRPYNSQLACTKLAQLFNIVPNDWADGLMKVVNNLL
jgi:dTDP-4-dehydrorhamnose reductase